MSSPPRRVLVLVGVLMILALLGNHDKPEYTVLNDNEQNATSMISFYNPAKEDPQHHFNLDNNVILMTISNGGNGGSDSLVDAKTDRE